MALFALLMVGPGIAVAHKGALTHHGKRAEAKHHVRKHHGARVRIRHFGSSSSQSSTAPSSSDHAGTVKSFMGNTLIITVNGSDVSGTVAPSTELECRPAAGMATAKMSRDGGAQPGDDNGRAGDQGDANDQAEDRNDVNDQNDADDQNDVNDQNASANCTSADLAPGAMVREAVLRVSSAGSTWEKVELVK
jgi:hypothetical protein